MAERHDSKAEAAYFTAYQKHIKTKSPKDARAAATKESGTTPKLSWVGKLKGGVKAEMEREAAKKKREDEAVASARRGEPIARLDAKTGKKIYDRTDQVSDQLKKSGLTQAQIDRLKGK